MEFVVGVFFQAWTGERKRRKKKKINGKIVSDFAWAGSAGTAAVPPSGNPAHPQPARRPEGGLVQPCGSMHQNQAPRIPVVKGCFGFQNGSKVSGFWQFLAL